MRNQKLFPKYENFYSKLKEKNVELQVYNEAKREYDRRLALPDGHDDKYYNFSDYLKTYQMR